MNALTPSTNGNDDDDKEKRNRDSIEFEQVEIWSEEWQCNVERSRSRSRGEDDEQHRPAKSTRDQDARKADWGKDRGMRPSGSLLDVRRPTLPERVRQLGQRWTTVSHHYGVDIVATKGAFQDRPRHNKGKRKVLSKGKRPAVWTRPVTLQSWSHCVQLCGISPRRTSTAGRR